MDLRVFLSTSSAITATRWSKADIEDIIPIKDIESFNVEEKNNENVITITNVNTKKMIFLCNDENDHKMAIKMFELIPGLK